MSLNEEERRAQLAEVIEMGEELFEMALANQGEQANAEEGQQKVGRNVAELREAAEIFFRVLRKLAVAQTGEEG